MNNQDLIEEQHIIVRQEVWVKAWTAVATSSGCNNSLIATKWADDCLAAFDTRFSAPILDKDTFINTVIEARR